MPQASALPPVPQRIGFVGLGMMGTPMAQCLARAGFELFVTDVDTARIAALAESVNAGAVQPAFWPMWSREVCAVPRCATPA